MQATISKLEQKTARMSQTKQHQNQNNEQNCKNITQTPTPKIETMTKTTGLLHKQQHQHQERGNCKSIMEKTTPKPKSKHRPKLFEHCMNNNTKIKGTTRIDCMSNITKTEAMTKFS